MKGLSLCDQTDQQFEISLTGIIFNISVICGCQLPTHDAHINALEKEFGIFLKENGYSGLTVDEVITAFRFNANFNLPERVEIYGAIFNIDFASKVLRQYVKLRSRIDEKAENVFYERDVKVELQKEDDTRRRKIIQQFEIFLSDENAQLDLSNCFMQLRSDGAFLNKKVEDELSYFRGIDSVERLVASFEQLDKKFEQEKAVVRYLFEQMKKTGRLKIYDENLKLLYPGFELPEKSQTQSQTKEKF